MPPGHRRYPRYPANLRLRLHLPTGELETTTEDISLVGFSAPCAPSPEFGTQFGFVLHLPDNRLLSGTALVVRVAADGSAGFGCEFAPPEQVHWKAFVDQEAASGGLWRMIGRYAVNQGQEKEAARSVLEKGPLGILFKKIGAGSGGVEAAPVTTRLHMVGENGEAYRVAFEKHHGVKPDDSDLATTLPGFRELAKVTVGRVLAQDVYLKRSPQAVIGPARLVELLKGGFGVVASHPDAPPSLVGLHGAELIVVEVDGKSVFPFFEPSELDRIALDNFRRQDEKAPAAVPEAPTAQLGEERFAASYAHKELATQQPAKSSQRDVRDAMAIAKKIQTRSYGARTIRLFPDLWLEVLRPHAWAGPVRGFAMEDGLQLCVFVLVGQDAPRVVVLEPSDVISIIRGLVLAP